MTAVKPRQSRKKLEADLVAKSRKIASQKTTEKSEQEIELEQAVEKPKQPPKKRVPPPGFKKKQQLDQIVGIESKPISELSEDDQRSIEDERYWRNHWKEIDELIQEDVNALDLTLEERVKLAKLRKKKE